MGMSSNNSFDALSRPNTRNSETIDPLRRSLSFSGNPFPKPSVIANPRIFNPNTPADSPSDFPRRNSFGGRESIGSFRDLYEKENGEDRNLKAAKVRSRAYSLKGTKNFMSPTISASSKTTVSPRKNFIVERNEPVRASISSTDGKSPVHKVTMAEPFEGSDLKPGIAPENKMFKALSESGPKPGVCKVTFAVPLEDSDLKLGDDLEKKNLEASFSSSTSLAPLDADPLMPPYDPKTNYLVPRPQFLYYRPKPLRYKDRYPLILEESYISGSFSDTEVAEEIQSEDSHVEDEDEDRNSEPSPTERLISKEAEEAPKPRFFMRFKAIALLLLLSVACISISVTSSPVNDPLMFEELSIFSKIHESSDFFEFSKANFDSLSKFTKANSDWLTRNVLIWYNNFMSSVYELISKFGGVHYLARVHYCNLSVLHEDISAYQYPIFIQSENQVGEVPQLDSSLLSDEENDTEIEINEDIKDISAEYYSAYEEHFPQDMEVTASVEIVSDALDTEEILESQQATAMEPSESRQALQQTDVIENDAEIEINEDIKDISPKYYSAYEEHFPQDMEVTASVEIVSDALDTEEILESQQATAMEPSESRQALQQTDVIENDAEIEINEDIKDISPKYYSAYEEHFPQDMEVTASVEIVSDALDTEEILESQQATAMEPSESRQALQQTDVIENDAEIEIIEDIKDISAEYYSAYEEHFPQDMEVTASVEIVSDALDAEEILESQQATAMEPSESRQALQQTDMIETNLYKSNVDVANQPGSEASKLDIEAFEASKQAPEMDAGINADKIMNIDLKNQPELNSVVAEIHLEADDDATVDMQPTEAPREAVNVDRENEPRLEVYLPPYMLPCVVLFLCSIATAALNSRSTKVAGSRKYNSRSTKVASSRKYNSRSTKVTSSVEQPQFSKALQTSVPKMQISLDKPSLRNNGPTEMVKTSLSNVPKESRELKESVAYGSFTSYEKILSKHGHGDESTITPVRRSSTKENGELKESLAGGGFISYEKILGKHQHGDESTITPVRRSCRIRNRVTSPL